MPAAPSTTNTLAVPAQGSDPVPLAKAAQTPLRVLVRNVGGAAIVLAYDPTAILTDQPMAGTFRLPAGQSETFVLQPTQSLVAAAIGANGLASVATSEALPQVWAES